IENKIDVKAVPVKVKKIKKIFVTETIKIVGEIIPYYRIDVYPRLNGIVVSEHTGLGKEVKKGQVLAEIIQDIPGMEFSPVKIVATRNGKIIMDAVELGKRVSIQHPVYTISKLKQVYLKTEIIQPMLGKLKIGIPVLVETDAYPGKKFNGKIAEINPIMNRLSRTFEIKILLNNPDFMLKPGMFAVANLPINKHKNFVVPLDAIVRNGSRKYIFIIENKKAKKVKVKTGIIQNNNIEIVSPTLTEGKPVVVLGQNMLKDNTPVRIVEDF
ncbi:hypothetical protein DRQ09_05480, partial [candidate division KSB1 bacterium]